MPLRPSACPRLAAPVPHVLAPAALLLPALLAGCGGSDSTAAAPACPAAAILGDAADMSRYRGTGHDLTDLVIDGRIAGLAGACRREADGTLLHTEVSVRMDLSRGPAATGRTASLAYFVAVTEGDQILDKRVIPLRVEFPANADRIHLEGERLELALPTPPGKSGASYQVLVGFQLTPEDLAFNRARGPR